MYYWFLCAITFYLFLCQWQLFPIEQAKLGVRLDMVGQPPHRNLGVMERQYMVSIHNKSPVREVLIPPTKHEEGKTLSWGQDSSI